MCVANVINVVCGRQGDFEPRINVTIDAVVAPSLVNAVAVADGVLLAADTALHFIPVVSSAQGATRTFPASIVQTAGNMCRNARFRRIAVSGSSSPSTGSVAVVGYGTTVEALSLPSLAQVWNATVGGGVANIQLAAATDDKVLVSTTSGLNVFDLASAAAVGQQSLAGGSCFAAATGTGYAAFGQNTAAYFPKGPDAAPEIIYSNTSASAETNDDQFSPSLVSCETAEDTHYVMWPINTPWDGNPAFGVYYLASGAVTKAYEDYSIDGPVLADSCMASGAIYVVNGTSSGLVFLNRTAHEQVWVYPFPNGDTPTFGSIVVLHDSAEAQQQIVGLSGYYLGGGYAPCYIYDAMSATMTVLPSISGDATSGPVALPWSTDLYSFSGAWSGVLTVSLSAQSRQWMTYPVPQTNGVDVFPAVSGGVVFSTTQQGVAWQYLSPDGRLETIGAGPWPSAATFNGVTLCMSEDGTFGAGIGTTYNLNQQQVNLLNVAANTSLVVNATVYDFDQNHDAPTCFFHGDTAFVFSSAAYSVSATTGAVSQVVPSNDAMASCDPTWSACVAKDASSTLVYVAGLVFDLAANGTIVANVTSLNAFGNTVAWTSSVKDPSSRVLTIGSADTTAAFRVWPAALRKPAHKLWSNSTYSGGTNPPSLTAAGGIAILTYQANFQNNCPWSMASVDVDTGSVLWSTPALKSGQVFPCAIDVPSVGEDTSTVLAMWRDGHELVGINARTGAPAFRRDVGRFSRLNAGQSLNPTPVPGHPTWRLLYGAMIVDFANSSATTVLELLDGPAYPVGSNSGWQAAFGVSAVDAGVLYWGTFGGVESYPIVSRAYSDLLLPDPSSPSVG